METMIAEIIPYISQIGFPMFVAIWWMVKGEKVITNNTEMLNQVKALIQDKKN